MPITPLKAFLSVAAVAVVGVTSAYVAGVFDRARPDETAAKKRPSTPERRVSVSMAKTPFVDLQR